MIRREALFQESGLPVVPILSDADTAAYFRRKIEGVASRVLSPLRWGNPLRMGEYSPGMSMVLFRVSPDEFDEFNVVLQARYIPGKIETDRGQEILFEKMKEFGFDETSSKLGWKSGLEWSDYRDRTKEYDLFPSQTIPGLVFTRLVTYLEPKHQPCSAMWSVEDRAPVWRIDLRRLSKLRLL